MENFTEIHQNILKARENRAFLRKQIALNGQMNLSISLNVPGYPKTTSLLQSFFNFIIPDFENYALAHRITLKQTHKLTDAAGDFYLSIIENTSFSAKQIKQICENYEEKHPLGRLIDIDIYDENGLPESSGKSKLCFFCKEKPAIECMREKNHSYEEIRNFMLKEIEKFLANERYHSIVKEISSIALRAILYEVSLTPKPGLVDTQSSGSHSDMNYYTFLDSSSIISQYFSSLAQEGLNFKNKQISEALPIIRTIGLQMEHDMYQITNKVNTQKGLIFLMSVSIFASAMILSEDNFFSINSFREKVKQICKGISIEFQYNNKETMTHGEKVQKKFGAGGARAEAENGFPTVFTHGIIQLKNGIQSDSLQKALVAIIAENSDTNILFRKGEEKAMELRTLANQCLNQFSTSNYQRLIDFCKMENISPGGSADLLAITIFVYLVNEKFVK